jgi:predicted ATPase
MEAIGDLLGRDAVRLVTLVGPGGIGKTRLAIAAAQQFTPLFPDGVFFVPLAEVGEPELIGQAVAAALGVSSTDTGSSVAPVIDLMRDRRALLLLDNFEHLVAGAPIVAQLLASCPQLSVVVTSRASLRLRGEREVEVGPLAVPDVMAGGAPADTYPAVQLFVEAAGDVRPGFAIDERSGPAVAEICRLLDGLPLAIELAAAMVRVLTPEFLLQRLRDHRTDLGAGFRDMPERHQTLRATIAWSYDLLDGPARDLFEQLGVFRGGFSLEFVERICEADDVVNAMATLAEHSLVRTDVHCGCGARFSMLSTIRHFATERLDARPGATTLKSGHAEAFAELVERVDGPGGHNPAVLDAVEVDLDNIRQAFDWMLDTGQPARVAEAIGRSWWFWWMRGYITEGKLWVDRCLAATGLPEPARSQALVAQAMFALWSGRYDAATEAFASAANAGDPRTVAYADIGVGLVRGVTTSLSEGRRLIQRGIDAFEELGDSAGAATGIAASAWVQAITRRFDDHEEQLREALGQVLANGSEMEVGIVQSALAQLLMRDGLTPGVVELLASALERFASARDIGSSILTLEVIAELAIGSSVGREAAVLLGATATIRRTMGTRVPPTAAARLDQLVATAREALGEEFAAAFERGSAMSYADAVDQGRALLGHLRSATAQSSGTDEAIDRRPR